MTTSHNLFTLFTAILLENSRLVLITNKKAMLSQGNRAMPRYISINADRVMGSEISSGKFPEIYSNFPEISGTILPPPPYLLAGWLGGAYVVCNIPIHNNSP